MKLFTTAHLTLILVLVGGMVQAVPLTSEGPGTSTALTPREVFSREPVLFYGRQLEHDLEERGILGFLGHIVGKVVEKVGGKNGGGTFGKIIKKATSIASRLPI